MCFIDGCPCFFSLTMDVLFYYAKFQVTFLFPTRIFLTKSKKTTINAQSKTSSLKLRNLMHNQFVVHPSPPALSCWIQNPSRLYSSRDSMACQISNAEALKCHADFATPSNPLTLTWNISYCSTRRNLTTLFRPKMTSILGFLFAKFFGGWGNLSRTSKLKEHFPL